MPPRVWQQALILSISDREAALALRRSFSGALPTTSYCAWLPRATPHDPEQLTRQVQRMLADPKAQSLVTHFAFQWLNVAKLAEIEPDARLFPYASGPGDLREDFRTELRLFIASVFREDRSVMDLLTADYTFVNERLALHYGIRDVKGDRFRRVQLTQSARYGLLGKGAVLMLTSYPTRTAPVLRGEWILDNITGTPPAAPPPAVPALKENEAGKTFHSIRELMESHRSKSSCFSCHGVLDPLGFALENFDATGKYRTLDRDTRAVGSTLPASCPMGRSFVVRATCVKAMPRDRIGSCRRDRKNEDRRLGRGGPVITTCRRSGPSSVTTARRGSARALASSPQSHADPSRATRSRSRIPSTVAKPLTAQASAPRVKRATSRHGAPMFITRQTSIATNGPPGPRRIDRHATAGCDDTCAYGVARKPSRVRRRAWIHLLSAWRGDEPWMPRAAGTDFEFTGF